MMKQLIIILIWVSFSCTSFTQEVIVSQEFNLRHDYNYDPIGLVGDHILLFRDRGVKFQLDVLDKSLHHKLKRDIRFEKRQTDIIAVVGRDSFFNIFYSYKHKGKTFVKVRKYNEKGVMIDSVELFRGKSDKLKGVYKFRYSSDKKKALLFATRKHNKLNVVAIDQDSMKVIYNDNIDFGEFNLGRDFQDILIANNEDVFILMEKDNRNRKKEKHFAELFYIKSQSDIILSHYIDFRDMLSTNILLDYDKYNERVLVSGLYHDKNNSSSKGYYYISLSGEEIGGDKNLNLVEYGDMLLHDVYDRDKNKNDELKHFDATQVVFRRDGGFILMAEMNKELSRRNSYNGYNRYNNYQSISSWSNYYNEDILMISVNPDGREHWKNVLHKKQFSQDDDGIYSSYYLFKTPSRLRILYNDEIKKNNTVSEYVMDPLGNFERNSVLSTDNQKLRLRFKDAIQISENELLVPSESSYTLKLVKIRY